MGHKKAQSHKRRFCVLCAFLWQGESYAMDLSNRGYSWHGAAVVAVLTICGCKWVGHVVIHAAAFPDSCVGILRDGRARIVVRVVGFCVRGRAAARYEESVGLRCLQFAGRRLARVAALSFRPRAPADRDLELPGLLKLLPDREPVLTENRHDDAVVILTVAKDVLSLHSLDLVAALLVIRLATFIECVEGAVHLAKVQRVERVVKNDHLGFGRIAVTPKFLLADHGFSLTDAILPVDAVDADAADGPPAVLTDDERSTVAAFVKL